MNSWLFAAAVAVVALGVAVALQRWLAGLDYRLADETDAPAPSHRWVLVTLPIVALLLAQGLAAQRPLALAVAFCCALPVVAALVAIDIDVHRLPDRLTFPFAALAVAIAAVASVVTGQWDALLRAVLAGIALCVVFFVLVLVSPGGGGLGVGDVKFALGLGALLGWFSWGAVVAGALLTFIIGGLWAVGLVLARRASRHSYIAFGPFMAIGSLVSLYVSGSMG